MSAHDMTERTRASLGVENGLVLHGRSVGAPGEACGDETAAKQRGHGYPFTHSTCLRACTTSTRSDWLAITSSIFL